jgi:tetrapyrrole methylase family protein/MazG family protein
MEQVLDEFRALVEIVRELRTPGTGCPWDLEQNHHTLRRYLLEESHEVLDAIDRHDDPGLCEELGDLLLQVVLHAQVAEDRGVFSLVDSVRSIARKMVRRHPHVFGKERAADSAEVRRNWEAIKAAEQKEQAKPVASPLERIPLNLPALHRAQRVVETLARTHAESLEAILERTTETLRGLVSDLGMSGERREEREQLIGSLLLDVCRLAGRAGVQAEDSLRTTTGQTIAQSLGGEEARTHGS